MKDGQRMRGRRGLEAPHRLRDLVVDPLLEPHLDEITLLEIGAEPGEGVLLLPHPDFFLGAVLGRVVGGRVDAEAIGRSRRSEEHTSELQSQSNLVCRLLLEKKKTRY